MAAHANRERRDPAELRALANSDPVHAVALGNDALSSAIDSAYKSEVCRAIAIAQRVLGDVEAAARAALEALDLASEAADDGLARLASMTLAPIRAQQGQISEALRLLQSAETGTTSIERAEVQFQRGGLYYLVARFEESCAQYDRAVPAFREADEKAWLADALLSRATSRACSGLAADAAADLVEARALFLDLGDDVGVASVAHNSALATFTGGDPGQAVVQFDEAAKLLVDAGFPVDLYRADQCEALLAAGLHAEAVALGRRGSEALDRVGNVLEAATQRLTLAQTLLRSNRIAEAEHQAALAAQAFSAQDQGQRADYVQLISLQSVLLTSNSVKLAGDVASEADEIAKRLRGSGHAEWRAAALLVAARAHMVAGEDERAHRALTLTARHHHSFVQELERLSIAASLAKRHGQRGSVLRFCRRAIRSVHVANKLAGSTLVRSSMSRHLDDIVSMGVDALLQAGRARDALVLIEQAQAQIGTTSAKASSSQFAEHRALTRALAEASNEQRDTTQMLERRRFLEDEIRAARTYVLETVPPAPTNLALNAMVRRYVDAGASIVALDLRHGRVRAVPLGDEYSIAALIDELNFLLGRSLRSDGVVDGLAEVAAELDVALGCPGALVGTDEVVHVVSATSLPSFPWGLLPSLSTVQWTIVQRTTDGVDTARPVRTGVHVALVGSGLTHARSEVEKVGAVTRGLVEPIAGRATCARTLELMNEASFVHLAAHATINPGNLMFSSITMSDGDLSLHELESIENPPRTVVLATCDSASTEHVGTASLGLATGLLAAGIETVVGTGCAIPDSPDTVAVMAQLHAADVFENPVRAVHETVNAEVLTESQRLIAQCLVVCAEHPG